MAGVKGMKRGLGMTKNEHRRKYRAKPRGRQKYLEASRRRVWNAKMECLKHYGGDPPACACCGETNIGFLTFDHVNNDGGAHRFKISKGRGANTALWLKKHGFPTEPPIQVLCFNCNCGRQYNGGVCPHKRAPLDWRSVRQAESASSVCETPVAQAPMPLFDSPEETSM